VEEKVKLVSELVGTVQEYAVTVVAVVGTAVQAW